MSKILHQLRDMAPYVDIIRNIARFHRADEAITIFEIGVRRGASTRALLQGVSERLNPAKGRVYSCDVDDRSSISSDSYWTFFHQNSQTIDWKLPIDLLLIDGEHTYAAVKGDFEKYEPFVNPGGIIILHDMNDGATDAARFWPEITYPKIVLNFNFSGLGIVTKLCPTPQ